MKHINKLSLLFFLILVLASSFMACTCDDCNNIDLSSNQSWFLNSPSDTLSFKSLSTNLSQDFVWAEAYDYHQTDKVCNDNETCSAQQQLNLFTIFTDSLGEKHNVRVGDKYIEVTEHGDYVGVFNIFEQQLYQREPNGEIFNGSGNQISLNESIFINGTLYDSVYVAEYSNIPSAPEGWVVTLYYNNQYGLLRFDEQGGEIWVKN